MLTLSTLYRYEKTEKMKTSMNILSEIDDRKESEEGKNISKQMCVSSQNIQYEKRRGRHGRRLSAILFPTFSQRAASCGPDGQRSSMETFKPSAGKSH